MPIFLSPLGGLVALAAVLPLAAALLRERRLRRVRAALGLAGPGRGRLGTALAAAGAVALLGVAAAQPALSRTHGVPVRKDAEAYAVFDTTRSMLAVQRRGGPTRFARARALALSLRDDLPEVPWGIATFSDRTLITLFPSGDRALFAAGVQQAVGVQRPAPGYRERNATSMQTLSSLAGNGFFAPSSRHRVAVVFTDGETQRVNAPTLAEELAAARIHVVVVRLWSPADRVYDARGRDEGYRPDPAGAAQVAALRASGIPVVPEREFARVRGLVQSRIGSGPTVPAQPEQDIVPLAPFAILAALVPAGFVLVRGRR